MPAVAPQEIDSKHMVDSIEEGRCATVAIDRPPAVRGTGR